MTDWHHDNIKESALYAGVQEVIAASGQPLGAQATQQLFDYIQLLLRWNQTYNLSALRTFEEVLSHHVADCLAVVGPLRRHAAGRVLNVLDVGSGAGLPGIILAIAEPSWVVRCVDAVGKKVSFIRQAGMELALPNLKAIHSRIESLPRLPAPDLIISRALATLGDFVTLTQHCVTTTTVWVAMKGRMPYAELETLPPECKLFHVEQLKVPSLNEERRLIWLKPTPVALMGLL